MAASGWDDFVCSGCLNARRGRFCLMDYDGVVGCVAVNFAPAVTEHQSL